MTLVYNYFPDPLFKNTSAYVTKNGDVTVTGYDSNGDHLIVTPTSDASGYAQVDIPFTLGGTYEFHTFFWVRDVSVGSFIDDAWIRIGYINANGKWTWLVNMTGAKSLTLVALSASFTVPSGVKTIRLDIAAGKQTGNNVSLKSPVLCTPAEWTALQSLGVTALYGDLMPLGGGLSSHSNHAFNSRDWGLVA
ncbi:hypothetical protein JS533_001745 [Bifidobacterium amazonense]|uniref:Uncharacterized protein n=1 Tax=Bifidobacterium amazonense TaxID=2809027 RepID=A0ABS9VSF0_9BIFI|nr:hypothetical protein [Bifidobacterium amazonense]MCH9275012.1 hypothetical protein [Bifidobacterium amazonense]